MIYEVISLPLTQLDLTANGIVQTHCTFDRWVWREMSRMNENLKDLEQPRFWMKVTAVANNGNVEKCFLRISLKAVEKFSEFKKTTVTVHKLALIAAGVVPWNIKLGSEYGEYSIDHADSNPANNILSNLRVLRHEINGMRKSGTMSGHCKNRKKFAYGKPMFDYLREHFGSELSQELLDLGYDGKSQVKSPSKPLYESQKLKSKMGLAVLRFLKEKEGVSLMIHFLIQCFKKHKGNLLNQTH